MMIDKTTAGSLCMIILSLGGLVLVLLNTLSNTNPARKESMLKKFLWKLDEEERLFASMQRIALGKFICSGIMLNAIVVALLLRLLSVETAIYIGVVFFLVWFSTLLGLWYYYISTVNLKPPPPTPSASGTSSLSAPELNFSPGKDPANRLRITIVTGFLGSGKTTLIQRILNNTKGLKILVIENEIGSEGIDHELLLQSNQVKEDIILLNNGCICCTVRKDLLTTFRQLFQSEAFEHLDWVVIETTGLADPAPLIQSFYMDKECREKTVIDSVLTVVDAKHLPLHLTSRHKSDKGDQAGAHGNLSEAILQLLYADRILLNKKDLVSSYELEQLEKSIRELNATAKIFTSVRSEIDISEVLNINAFDPQRFTKMNYDYSGQSIMIQRDTEGKILKNKQMFNLRKQLNNSNSKSGTKEGSHKKDKGAVGTISLMAEDPIDLEKFNVWITDILQSKGPDIFRMKGILAMKGYDEQFIFHAIHMIFDGQLGPHWDRKEKKRISKMVIIGKNLNKEELEMGFREVLA